MQKVHIMSRKLLIAWTNKKFYNFFLTSCQLSFFGRSQTPCLYILPIFVPDWLSLRWQMWQIVFEIIFILPKIEQVRSRHIEWMNVQINENHSMFIYFTFIIQNLFFADHPVKFDRAKISGFHLYSRVDLTSNKDENRRFLLCLLYYLDLQTLDSEKLR